MCLKDLNFYQHFKTEGLVNKILNEVEYNMRKDLKIHAQWPHKIATLYLRRKCTQISFGTRLIILV